MENGYVYINDLVFPTLLAISTEEQGQGLMFQEWPPPVMSFLYTSPRVNKFWMKNTPSPLDIVFCCNGKVTQLHYGEPHSTSVIGNESFSDLIVELPHGLVEASEIKIGQSVGLAKPSPTELRKILAEKYPHFVKF